MDKRYQVFVSSTFEDLIEERRVIIENLLNAKYIPAGMELFSASNDQQFEYIKKIIDTCDYYVLIIGARYGSINPSTGISFTEQEYDYAVKKKIPILAFVHKDPYNLPAHKREDDKRELLERFKEKVFSGRLCRTWTNLSDLSAAVIISLAEEIRENPQQGWVRNNLMGNDIVDNEEIQRLQAKNEELKTQTKQLQKLLETANMKVSVCEKKIAEMCVEHVILGGDKTKDKFVVNIAKQMNNKVTIKYMNGKHAGVIYTTWKEILMRIGTPLSRGCDIWDFQRFLSKWIVVGEGNIFRDDVERVTEYLLENAICAQNKNRINLTVLGKALIQQLR